MRQAVQLPAITRQLPSSTRQFADRNDNGKYDGLEERLLDRGLQPEDEVCVYRPKVQVLDNWGWCNGTCKGDEGCFNYKKAGQSGRNQCDNPNPKRGTDPWTYFKGKIIVIPSRR